VSYEKKGYSMFRSKKEVKEAPHINSLIEDVFNWVKRDYIVETPPQKSLHSFYIHKDGIKILISEENESLYVSNSIRSSNCASYFDIEDKQNLTMKIETFLREEAEHRDFNKEQSIYWNDEKVEKEFVIYRIDLFNRYYYTQEEVLNLGLPITCIDKNKSFSLFVPIPIQYPVIITKYVILEGTKLIDLVNDLVEVKVVKTIGIYQVLSRTLSPLIK